MTSGKTRPGGPRWRRIRSELCVHQNPVPVVRSSFTLRNETWGVLRRWGVFRTSGSEERRTPPSSIFEAKIGSKIAIGPVVLRDLLGGSRDGGVFWLGTFRRDSRWNICLLCLFQEKLLFGQRRANSDDPPMETPSGPLRGGAVRC